jgi:hypothetical protein
MICKPYKSCNKYDIIQTFGANPQFEWQPKGHTGVDFVSTHGTFLVAPELCDITNIIGSTGKIDTDLAPFERGFGVVMRSVANPKIYYLYWHCLPVFPVEIGQRVIQGQIVGQMDSSGFCWSRGIPVPINLRLIPPYIGNHLHAERREYKDDGTFEYTDILKYIDWDIPVNYDALTTIKDILNKIMNILKK